MHFTRTSSGTVRERQLWDLSACLDRLAPTVPGHAALRSIHRCCSDNTETTRIRTSSVDLRAYLQPSNSDLRKTMPSVTQDSPTAPSSKKRRLDDSHHHPQLSEIPSNSPRSIFVDKSLDHGMPSLSPLSNRKIIPTPSAKRQRMAPEVERGADGEPMQRSPSNSPSQRQRHHHHPHQQPKSPSREELHDRTRPTDPSGAASGRPSTTSSASLMGRCHICFRKPTKKTDLDSFADCQGCGQRTCYVCIRECLGWGPPMTLQNPQPGTPGSNNNNPQYSPATLEHETSFTMLDADAVSMDGGHHQPSPTTMTTPEEREHGGWARGGGHRQVVCSRCCVEKGSDGDVVCLGCLPFVEG
ncbi:hypothetical protein VTK26DRAFT_8499 [Humicola hyalothermophila]